MSTQRLAHTRLASVGPAGAGPDALHMTPSAISLDDSDTPCDVIDALILPVFADGRQPYARTARVQEVRPGAALTPPGSQLLRVAEDYDRQAWLAAGDGWTIRSVLWRTGSAEVTVTATADELAAAVLDQVIAEAAAERAADAGEVTVGFWYRSERRGPIRSARPVSAEPWDGIRANYAGATAGAVDQLMAITPDSLSGRLILLYGPPGTGKTTALRALAREWLPWCDTDCVLDPELLFAEPRYLMEVALGDDEDTERWRLLLLEDCDELISGDARRAAGQALSRLLNLTDGLLGQGRRVLAAITTNENIGALHPAAVRPGRCLAQIEVGPLPGAEAARWLGEPDGSVGPMSLADLYAHRTVRPPITSEQPAPAVGLYL